MAGADPEFQGGRRKLSVSREGNNFHILPHCNAPFASITAKRLVTLTSTRVKEMTSFDALDVILGNYCGHGISLCWFR